MVVSEGVLKIIEEKVKLYDAAKRKIKARIENNVNVAIERLDSIKNELLDEVEREFGRNPFAEFLSYGNNPTDVDARRLLAEQKIPENFGPDEKSFSTLSRDIDSLKEWQNKLNPLNFVPKDLKANSVTCDSIALSWVAVKSNSDWVYEIELRSSTSLKSVHHSEKSEHTLYNLKPGTEYHIRVRSVLFHKDMKCVWSNPITVKTKSLHIRDVSAKAVSWDEIEVSWTTDDECDKEVKHTVKMRKGGEKDWEEVKSRLTDKKCRIGGLTDNSMYEFCVRCVAKGGSSLGEWSGVAKERTMKAFKCVWKECPGYVDEYRKYSVDETNPRVATKVNSSGNYCTIIGNTHVPLNKVTSWSIKIHKSKNNNGDLIYIGVAPFDIDQNDGGFRGWYFYCYWSKLCSGPPHNYGGSKEYGPRKDYGQYVHTGDSVGVVMDTTKGELSFVLNGVNLGVAYEGIPLDKPLVPCVLLRYEGDSVELDISEAKENADSSIPVPSNIIAESTTWDSITLTWDKVSDALSYQIEVDGNKSWDASATSIFTKRGLLPETEHSFRVRTVRESSVSEWSDVVRERTSKASEFSGCVWKKCPDYVTRKYDVNEKNLRIATKNNWRGYDYCTIIGNIPIPLNTVTSWSIKILKSIDNNGKGIYVGVAPSDINQNEDYNSKHGWHFYCGSPTLCSGPPHNYKWKEYGPRKRKDYGQYVHTGDSVGVVVDTTRGDLSFVLNGVNHGVAFEGIPLDKPLVPCVLLDNNEDSVELDISKVKENVDSSIPIPSKITAKIITWGSITFTWDKVSDALSYQIEVDGNKSWDASTTSIFTKKGLLPETEHSFRVRTVRGNSVSKWSGVVKRRTSKASVFSGCVWEECPGYVNSNSKYNVDGGNPRVATKINEYDYCTIIGNTSIPLNAVTSWSIKIHKSKDNNGDHIYIGIAPNDINQNVDCNHIKCGWYFHCYYSELHSGPPRNYWNKPYGPMKRPGQYVHTGDSVGVVMDTTKGNFSFVLNGVNHSVAFEGIPLDKPLVPCVILKHQGDSVELII